MSRESQGSRAENEYERPINLSDLFGRVLRGGYQILGLASLVAVAAALGFVLLTPVLPETTSTRIVFSFPGYSRGQYPDGSKFQPDDLRSPDVLLSAMERQAIPDAQNLQAKIRSALSVEGIIPPAITKERDRMRAAGQTPPTYFPDEYILTLTLPRSFPLAREKRELLLQEVISVYLDRFQRTYASLPSSFGNAFKVLQDSDFFEYELVLGQELQRISQFLSQLATEEQQGSEQNAARSFRSATTNLSFGDLLSQTRLFSQIRVNETLGLIYLNGLTRDRSIAMTKLDYHLRSLEDRENRAVQEESVVRDLLAQSHERQQNYVLGIRSQTEHRSSQSPFVDQGLINSLLENDAYNFLVRRALDAGLNVRRIQSEKQLIQERRRLMERFLSEGVTSKNEVIVSTRKSLSELEAAYNLLITKIRETHKDYARQQFADAIRITAAVRTESFLRQLAIAAGVGAVFGAIAGIGLSVLNLYIRPKRT